MVPALIDAPTERFRGRPGQHARSDASTSGNGSTISRKVDLPVIEDAVRTILRAVGEDPDRPGLLDAPQRVARMYPERFAGLHQDPARHLKVTFSEEYVELVLVRDYTREDWISDNRRFRDGVGEALAYRHLHVRTVSSAGTEPAYCDAT